MEKRKRIEAELKAMGINTIEELNEAIVKERALDVSIMTVGASQEETDKTNIA